MRVFVARASGAIGEPLIAELLKQGHSVVGMTSSEARGKNLERQGVEAAIVDAFDAAGIEAALRRSKAEVVIDELTSLPKEQSDMPKYAAGDRKLRIVQCRCGLEREGDGHPSDSNRIPKSLAKRSGRALGWQCAAGFARSCDRHQPKASATVAERVRPLLPRRPDSSRTREGHSRWASSNISTFESPQGYLVAATRRVASPLYCRGLGTAY